MNGIDWIIVAILAFSGVISLLRGFTKEVISLITWVLAFVIAMVFSSRLAYLLADYVSTPSLQIVLAFVILFFSALIVGGLVNTVISSLIKATGLGLLDRLLGVFFGVARGAIAVLAVLIIVPSFVSFEEQIWWQESLLIPHFLMLQDWAIATFSEINQWRSDLIQSL